VKYPLSKIKRINRLIPVKTNTIRKNQNVFDLTDFSDRLISFLDKRRPDSPAINNTSAGCNLVRNKPAAIAEIIQSFTVRKFFLPKI
jgi:hypothetical protein